MDYWRPEVVRRRQEQTSIKALQSSSSDVQENEKINIAYFLSSFTPSSSSLHSLLPSLYAIPSLLHSLHPSFSCHSSRSSTLSPPPSSNISYLSPTLSSLTPHPPAHSLSHPLALPSLLSVPTLSSPPSPSLSSNIVTPLPPHSLALSLCQCLLPLTLCSPLPPVTPSLPPLFRPLILPISLPPSPLSPLFPPPLSSLPSPSLLPTLHVFLQPSLPSPTLFSPPSPLPRYHGFRNLFAVPSLSLLTPPPPHPIKITADKKPCNLRRDQSSLDMTPAISRPPDAPRPRRSGRKGNVECGIRTAPHATQSSRSDFSLYYDKPRFLPHRVPLYESLVSCMSDLDDDSVAFPDAEAEHEYQQIPALDPFADKAARAPRDSPRSDKNGASGKRRDASGSSSDGQKETQHIAASKLNTLDVKPEKGASKESSRREESLVCHCQRKSPERRHSSAKLSPASRTSGSGSSQSLSSQDNHKSAIYISNTTICRRDESAQESSDSDDTYQDISDAPTVIHVISHKDSKDSVKKPDSSHAPKERSNASFSPADGHRLPPRSGHTASSGSTKTCLKTRANSAEKLPHSKAQGMSYPPLTIELSERKEDPAWGPDPGKARGGKTSSASHSSTPHIITTLDPPLKPATKAQTHYDSMSDIPPLVVNFDAEDSDSNSETFIDIGTSTVGGSTSIYLTEDETSSLYSSVPDLYSVVTTDPDSFVYVYKPPPRRQSLLQKRLQDSELDYRFPGYVIAR
ncbi:hypothetical protein C7M84_017648 [Penaeus vannamei]|uniref:Uncharacterized protein n=1 Tax=Penaeus vannamei TaxID=6689 RepID=A0A3R7PF93_PENVA|nr:hypothetical protein C7M84_017648 [Penaeus vannamei]